MSQPTTALAILWIASTSVLLAETFVVDTEADGMSTGCSNFVIGDCTLRGAIERANQSPGQDLIEFGFGVDTIQLTLLGEEDLNQTGDLDILDGIAILGNGGTTIDASAIGERAFDFRPANDELSTVQRLTVTGGGSSFAFYEGGGIRCRNHGSLSLYVANLVGNGPAGFGGGLLSDGCETTLGAVTVSGNTALLGGGISVWNARLDLFLSAVLGNHADSGGGLHTLGSTASLGTNVTFSGNTAVLDSSAILAVSHLDLEWVTIVSDPLSTVSTVVGSGTGIFFANSLLVGDCDPNGSYATWGGNLESPGDTCGLDPLVDQISVPDPGLLPLADYGGYVPGHLPRADSPAVDDPMGATTDCPDHDQRGFPRPVDGNGDGIDACDIGAIERAVIFGDGFESGSTSRWSSASP